MATLLLSSAGSALGGAAGGFLGSAMGRLGGAVAGSVIDRALLGTSNGRSTTGPRLGNLQGLTCEPGAAVPRVYGRVRIGGQLIWATRFEEEAVVTSRGSSGGKSIMRSAQPTDTRFVYYANFAVALCEGPIAQIRRIWADGVELDQSSFTIRTYLGTANQTPDPLIIAKEGSAQSPAYRGTAYVVFERMPLSDFGNRIPQLQFEVVKPVSGLADRITGVNIIPGASEYAYAVAPLGSTNRHQLVAQSDWTASLDSLQALCPKLESVTLIVTWFGDDLRAGSCTVSPRVERRDSEVSARPWKVAGLTRSTARLVTQFGDRPAFGGTPCDDSVIEAIADLKARGLKVVFAPFIMMDIPSGNSLPDPWSVDGKQAAFPWRGKITSMPAPGLSNTVDLSPAAGTQVLSFFGSTLPAVTEWSYRRFIFHYADLCERAGGVDGFLLGSEMPGLTLLRSAPGVYPAVQSLASLATDVRARMRRETKISYAANWDEYGAHVTQGGADVRFPLDLLWMSSAVDFVGINFYAPLSDWRDGSRHLDASVSACVCDQTYLAQGLRSGEAFDWFYASAQDRDAQRRTTINDPLGKSAWIFQPKALEAWWSNAHSDRVNGKESAAASVWSAKAKPIWLMEVGCPAVDRGANEPNIFPDAKASSAGLPNFSRGARDDLMQARMLMALQDVYGRGGIGNPMGARGPMIERMYIWAWDARPFPAFPTQSATWSDAVNWERGHWLNGRLEGMPLECLLRALLGEAGLTARFDAVDGFVDGYALDRVMSLREAIEPLTKLYRIDLTTPAQGFLFKGPAFVTTAQVNLDDCIELDKEQIYEINRQQDSELPSSLILSWVDGLKDYQSSSITARDPQSSSHHIARAQVSVVLSESEARRRTEIWLRDLRIGRESLTLSLPMSQLALEPGDVLTVLVGASPRNFRIETIVDGAVRHIMARSVERGLSGLAPFALVPTRSSAPLQSGTLDVVTLDLAFATSDKVVLQYLAVSADPWAGSAALYRARGSSFDFIRMVPRCATLGRSDTALAPSMPQLMDRSAGFRVKLSTGSLASVSEIQLLAGSNLAAVQHGSGAWEILGFMRAELVGQGLYQLSGLLRGLGGEMALAIDPVAAGARFVLLDSAVTPLSEGLETLGVQQSWRIGPASRDYADGSYVSFSSVPGAKALMPYAPIRVRAERRSDAVRFSFLRRARLNGDNWELADIPLGEASEAYELQILRNGSVVRSLTSTITQIDYSTALELTDFGSTQRSFDFTLFQKSDTVGRGFGLTDRVTIAP